MQAVRACCISISFGLVLPAPQADKVGPIIIMEIA
jgi:hypothetical protein